MRHRTASGQRFWRPSDTGVFGYSSLVRTPLAGGGYFAIAALQVSEN